MRLTPSFFGKLPIHGDFIRHRVSGSEIDELDQWLQNGIVSSRSALGPEWDSAFDATRPQRFLFQPPRGGRLIAGLIGVSKDRPGRRYFSIVHTAIDLSTLDGEPSLLPAALAPFFEAAEREAAEGWKGTDLKGFLARIDALPRPPGLDEAKRRVLPRVAGRPAGELWTEMFGAADDPRKYLLVSDLMDSLGGGTIPRYALRLPKVGGEVEVAFWLELVRKVSRRPKLPTLTLWGSAAAGSAPGLSLLMDELKANQFLPLWWPSRKSPLLFPLGEAASPVDPRLQQARGRYGGLLDDGSLRLASLLSRLPA
jgi:type VI secretion system protein ImpM